MIDVLYYGIRGKQNSFLNYIVSSVLK